VPRHKDHPHKRNISVCGQKTRGGQVTYEWKRVTCPVCLSRKPTAKAWPNQAART